MLVWTVTPFDAMSAGSLYDALALRQTVFVVEQRCAYLDCDGLDRTSLHLLGRSENGTLLAYARLVPPGAVYEEASIGRVVTAPSARRLGYGRTLCEEAITRAREAFGRGALRIGAQRYLEKFYSELGFETVGPPYDDDGIPHVQMVRPAEGRA